MKIADIFLIFTTTHLFALQVGAAGSLRSRSTRVEERRRTAFDSPCTGNFSMAAVNFKWEVTEYEEERPMDIDGGKITWGVAATKLGRSSFEATAISPINNIPPNELFKFADLQHINNVLKKGTSLKNVDLVMEIDTEQGNGEVINMDYAIRIVETCNMCETGENCSDDIIKIIEYNNIGESNGIQYKLDLFFKENPDGPLIDRWQTPEKNVTDLGLYGMLTVLGGTCAPTAKCKDETVFANEQCEAPAVSIDGGTYDIDSDDITIAEDFNGASFALGANLVTLVASDGERQSTCEGTVVVMDVTYPGVCCFLSPAFDVASPLTYTVEFSGTDNCLGVTAVAKIISANPNDKCDEIIVPSSGDTVTVIPNDECEYNDGVELHVTATDTSGNMVQCMSSAPALLRVPDTSSVSSTSYPTTSPSKQPTFNPTMKQATAGPSTSPTTLPTVSPTASPTKSPTTLPTANPSTSPTDSPSDSPSLSPTATTLAFPTNSPTASLTDLPSTMPTTSPTTFPTSSPSFTPTSSPVALPTSTPTSFQSSISTTTPSLGTVAWEECFPVLYADFEFGMSGWNKTDFGLEGHDRELGAAFLEGWPANFSINIPNNYLLGMPTEATLKFSYSFWSTEGGDDIFELPDGIHDIVQFELNRQNVDEKDDEFLPFHKQVIDKIYDSKDNQFSNSVSLTFNPSQARELQVRVFADILSSYQKRVYFEYINIETCTAPVARAQSCELVTVDFDDLAPGTYVTDLGAGITVSAIGKGRAHTPGGGAMVFDTSNPICNDGINNGDPDLGSPNESCSPSGPGEGVGGSPTASYPNCEPAGNILVIQERKFQDPSSPCPDDAADGGWIEFEFDTPVSLDMVQFLDVDEGTTPQITVSYQDENARSRTAVTKVTWTGDNGVITEYPYQDQVSKVSIEYFGSGSVAKIGYYSCAR